MSEAPECIQQNKSFQEIAENYDKLIKKTECELENFRKEQDRTQKQILKLLDENCRLSSKLDKFKSREEADSRDCQCRHEQETSVEEIVENLNKQNRCLSEENCTLKELWLKSQEIIRNLEEEVFNYQSQLIEINEVEATKQKFCKTINLLENTIQCQKAELAKQCKIIEDLLCQRDNAKKQVACLQTKLEDKEKEIKDYSGNNENNEKLLGRLSESHKTCNELEKSCQLAKQLLDEQTVREKTALQKVQEALAIADVALADKMEAIKREQAIRDECNNLAKTVGEVLEEAAQKVDQDIACIKNQFAENEKRLQEEHRKEIEQLEQQLNEKLLSDKRCECFEEMLDDIMKENAKLDDELQLASQAIVEMELKLEASENLLKEDNRSSRLSEERENEIFEYIRINQELKEKWKCTFEEVTLRFKAEICKLQEEYSLLRVENKAMQLKLLQSNIQN